MIPYGRHVIESDDLEAVTEVLRGNWLTTGPAVERFEESFASYVGAKYAVAVSNGTAALHLAMLAIGIKPGDEVIVPALTFAASANCVRYAGGTVVFADVLEDTLNIDVDHVASLITPRTRAVVAVDYAGLPADLQPLLNICRANGLTLIEDACHALGAEYQGRPVGAIADLSIFSFHPVKHMTTGEGGMVTSENEELASRVRLLRNHGISTNHRERELAGTWQYDMVELGYNYRLPDLLCALGVSQVKKLPAWLARRRVLADRYMERLADITSIRLPVEPDDRRHAWHLFPVRILAVDIAAAREQLYLDLRKDGIGV
ncbi:MAG TPA: aminotransferase class I/II-fold pyridoxal phosphate-dependent enzyme, partial [Pyrinomonadaceae bacterium]|nr:aminotransferase class I/II-fold pyridoxal phosphate-dependent enzyme [Pyrinomonadaceae bacterium]